MSAYVPNTDPNAWPQLPVFKPSLFSSCRPETYTFLGQERRDQHEFASVLPDVSLSIPACINTFLAAARSSCLPGQPLWSYADPDAAELVLLNRIRGDLYYIVTLDFAHVGSSLHVSMKGHLGYYLPWGTIAARMSTRFRICGLWLISLCTGIAPLRLGLVDSLLVCTGVSAVLGGIELRIDQDKSPLNTGSPTGRILNRVIGPALAAGVGFGFAKHRVSAESFNLLPLSYLGAIGIAVSAYYLVHASLGSILPVRSWLPPNACQTTGFFQTVQELLFHKVA